MPNLGYWDQHMAIRWVHDNIQHFGGDPNSVALAGFGAGGQSAKHQMFFSGNKGLFHRVIDISGSASGTHFPLLRY